MKTFWKIFDVAWGLVVIVALTLTAIYIPLRLIAVLEPTPWTMWTPWVITAIFILDVPYNFHLNARDREHWFSKSARLERYFKRRLAIDLLAAVPFHLFAGYHPVVMLRLLKLVRVQDIMYRWRNVTMRFATVLRLGLSAYWMAIAAHWIACGWIALRPIPAGEQLQHYYVRALYWAITTLSTVGYGDVTPTTTTEIMYAIFVMGLGVIAYGYVIGNIANLLNNLDLPRKHFFERSEQVRAFLQYHKIPYGLQRRISEYYAYHWAKQLGYDSSTALAELPPSLKAEVTLFLRRDVIQKVTLFNDADEEFLKDVAQQMRPLVIVPGEDVVRAGEEATSMYFVTQGELEVIAPDGSTIAALGEGDFFGETALLIGARRGATVRARTYCDAYVLERERLSAVLARYPQFAERIRQKARERER